MNNTSPTDRLVAGYVQHSPASQALHRDAPKREIVAFCVGRGLPTPVFYEDEMPAASGAQEADRPAFQRLLKDVAAGRVQLIIVSTLDHWSRNMTVTLQSLRALNQQGTGLIALAEQLDSSTPEGNLQLTIIAACADVFSEMLARRGEQGANAWEVSEA